MSALSLLFLALGGFSGDGAPIQWRERPLALDRLPAELPARARGALEAWHAWASALEYRLDLESEGRVLLISRRSNDRVPQQLELARAVLERFDRELPAPLVRAEAGKVAAGPKEPEKAAPDHKPLPEDPEDADGAGQHPWKLPPKKPETTSAKPVVTVWGSQGAPLDSETLVLFIVVDQSDFESLLGRLAEGFPFLVAWTQEAKALQGFVLGDPLAGAYLERPDGVEEWDPDHELVNRLARLLLLSRFGELPNWLVQGYAWHMEIALQHSVYCFPWRDEFVWASEHTGWHQIVKDRFAKVHIEARDFMAWRRGKYDDAQAKASWAMTEYLLAKEAEKLPDLLDELRVFREEHGRIQDDPSSWRRNVEYEIPVPDQHRLFGARLGEGYLDRSTIFFRQELAR